MRRTVSIAGLATLLANLFLPQPMAAEGKVENKLRPDQSSAADSELFTSVTTLSNNEVTQVLEKFGNGAQLTPKKKPVPGRYCPGGTTRYTTTYCIDKNNSVRYTLAKNEILVVTAQKDGTYLARQGAFKYVRGQIKRDGGYTSAAWYPVRMLTVFHPGAVSQQDIPFEDLPELVEVDQQYVADHPDMFGSTTDDEATTIVDQGQRHAQFLEKQRQDSQHTRLAIKGKLLGNPRPTKPINNKSPSNIVKR